MREVREGMFTKFLVFSEYLVLVIFFFFGGERGFFFEGGFFRYMVIIWLGFLRKFLIVSVVRLFIFIFNYSFVNRDM